MGEGEKGKTQLLWNVIRVKNELNPLLHHPVRADDKNYIE